MTSTSHRPAWFRSCLCLASAGLLAACGASTSISSTPDNTTVTAASQKAGNAPPKSTAPPKAAKLGDPITIKGNTAGEQVQVTLLKVANPTKGGEFDKPENGKQFAAVQFRVVNTGTAPYEDSPSNGAKLIDTDGQQFDSWIVTQLAAGPVMPSGVKLLPGKTLLGWIPFQVPEGVKLAGVQFSMNSGFGGTAEWELK